MPEESDYAVLNKAAWFVALPPVIFARRCRSAATGKASAYPQFLNLCGNRSNSRYFAGSNLAPAINGKPFSDYLIEVEMATEKEIPPLQRASCLRYCALCIREGIHLRLHQHLAIATCLIHNQPLASDCQRCRKLLSTTLISGQSSFSCEHCNESLIKNDRMAISHACGTRESAKSASEQFLAWRRKSIDWVDVECGAHHIKLPERHPLQQLTTRALVWEAACRASPPPGFIKRVPFPGVGIGIRCLDLRSGRKGSASTAAHFSQAEIQPFRHDERRYVDRYGLALRRVTTVFLRRYRRKHNNCLDGPYRMFGRRYDDETSHPEELLNCCPVAIGFWLWRLQASKDFIFEVLRTHLDVNNCGNMDLLFYGLARSHLHRLIYSAWQCVTGRGSGASTSQLALADLLHFGGYTAQRLKDEMGLDTSAYYMRFDASSAIDRMACRGNRGYVERLRRQLRAVTVYGRKFPFPVIDLEHTWEERQAVQEYPFAHMKHDGVFVSSKHKEQREWELLNAAINARGASDLANAARISI